MLLKQNTSAIGFPFKVDPYNVAISKLILDLMATAERSRAIMCWTSILLTGLSDT